MTIHGNGTPLKMSEITAEFTRSSLSLLRGVTWYLDNSATTGTFATNNLKFSDFYSKKASPSIVYTSGTQTYTTPGNYTFIVPVHAGTVSIEGWGSGGSGLPAGANGGDTVISWPGFTLTAGGGFGAGGGGRRYMGPPGAGGTATGATTNTPGNPGSAGTPYASGGMGGTAPSGSIAGGAGGAGGGPGVGVILGQAGHQPGGGGGGMQVTDGSGDPSFSGSGGGGSGALVATGAVNIAAGTVINITVGAGGAGDGIGGDGEVKIVWT